ncbi:MAG: hypothetical protein U5K69_21095 [Balneolaceae bacterium]|nr:hypothetical protein [Balneolaceae bacterium]
MTIIFRIPGLEINAKLRKGAEGGLKFKHQEQKKGPFEIWIEDEEEIYEFPLDGEAWKSLNTMFKNTDINLPQYPATPLDRETTVSLLEEAGCKILSATKQRETRILEMKNGTVLVEWAIISSPQRCVSIGLETWSQSETANLANDDALNTLKEALRKLNLDAEPLTPMNYLDAVKEWVKGSKI